MNTFMYLVGYDRQFREHCNTGWGCGYVALKEDHPLVIKHIAYIAKQCADNDEQEKIDPNYFSWIDTYLQVGDINQEITYTEWTEINGEKWLVCGFDTAHSYNNDTHDFNYVFNETLKIKEIIDKSI